MTQALQASHRRDKPLHTINCAALPWPMPVLDLRSCLARMASPACLPRPKAAPSSSTRWEICPRVTQAKLLQVLAGMVRAPRVRVIAPAIRIW